VPNWLNPPFVLAEELSKPAIKASAIGGSAAPTLPVPPSGPGLSEEKELNVLMLEVLEFGPGAAMFEPVVGP
jgi:hypothetical protein